MRVLAALALIAATTAACGGSLFRQYEYEEDMYIALDGTATLYVNSSIAALNALHGASFDPAVNAPLDRAGLHSYFSSPFTRVVRVASSRRSRRRFVHVRIEVDDVRRLGELDPFRWATYSFNRENNVYLYRQTVGPSANKPVGNVGWTGRELVAFRLHVPSKIPYHNAPAENLRRGNIVVWEQSLTDRLRGVPLELYARMETQSILYRTLWLFAATFVAVAITFCLVIWWVMRRGANSQVAVDAGVARYGTERGLGAHGAPARERSGAMGPPRATEPGYGAEPHQQ
jgi:hypothetical protein